ncbi:MAG TPA: hypothetical protein VJ914_19965 [Pseudonocardiaceae bacterium]|nr:hypothetical protein [Pseudonocardiaceae bacterium]
MWVLGLVLIPVLLAGAAFLGVAAVGLGSVAGAPHSRGTNGLWLGHTWVDSAYSPADLAALVGKVRAGEFRDLFVHVGPLSDNGSLNPALAPGAARLLTALHASLPGVRVQAWLGDVVGPGRMNLADPATRARIVASARAVLDLGFAGVHYDLEPVPSGDAGYLALLVATHPLTQARHAVLSVAADQLEPFPGLAGPEQLLAGLPHWWSGTFLGQVAGRVDEIAVMSYDTGMPTGAAYSGYVRMQTRLALDAVPARVSLLIGLPAYHTDELGHTGAETVAAAVRGVRLALRGESAPVGVAFYADFSATPADWSAYESGWVHPS